MQKTAYEMRISDWSSDVCSSDLSDHGDSLASAHAFLSRRYFKDGGAGARGVQVPVARWLVGGAAVFWCTLLWKDSNMSRAQIAALWSLMPLECSSNRRSMNAISKRSISSNRPVRSRRRTVSRSGPRNQFANGMENPIFSR